MDEHIIEILKVHGYVEEGHVSNHEDGRLKVCLRGPKGNRIDIYHSKFDY